MQIGNGAILYQLRVYICSQSSSESVQDLKWLSTKGNDGSCEGSCCKATLQPCCPTLLLFTRGMCPELDSVLHGKDCQAQFQNLHMPIRLYAVGCVRRMNDVGNTGKDMVQNLFVAFMLMADDLNSVNEALGSQI